jgi:hypothetical protein
MVPHHRWYDLMPYRTCNHCCGSCSLILTHPWSWWSTCTETSIHAHLHLARWNLLWLSWKTSGAGTLELVQNILDEGKPFAEMYQKLIIYTMHWLCKSQFRKLNLSECIGCNHYFSGETRMDIIGNKTLKISKKIIPVPSVACAFL